MSQVEKKSSEPSLSQTAHEILQQTVIPQTESVKISTTPKYKEHPALKMKSAEWYGREDIRVKERAAPTITDPSDVIVKITSTTVCGSDLHMYYNQVPGVGVLVKGDILGHEGVGIIVEVGPEVKDRAIGDRVVIAAPIACGQCGYCKKKEYSLCDTTNPSTEMETLYGHRTAGLFGYGHLTGGYAGLQSEYARVPFASVNTLKLPPEITDDTAVTLSDVLCTGWHGNELIHVKEGDTVVVFGCGPVGLCAQMCALARGAKMVLGIDHTEARLALCEKIGSKPINYEKEKDIYNAVTSRIPGGPDCCIDCVGFRFEQSLSHWFQRKLRLETDSPEIVNCAINVCRKGGNIALIGDYFDVANGFKIGVFMEKGLTMAGGQVFVQKYWSHLLELIVKGKLNPDIIFSHRLPFEEIDKAYHMFSVHGDDSVKIILKTAAGIENDKKMGKETKFGKLSIELQ